MMKNINVKHLKFILLIILFVLTGCSNKPSRDNFLADRFFYYDKDKLNIYEDFEYDKSPKLNKIGNTEYKQRYYKDDKDIEISPDGRFIYYIRYKNTSDSFGELVREDLYLDEVQRQNKSKISIYRTTKVISDNVSSFDMLFSGRVIYFNSKNNKISLWDGEKSKVIASDVAKYKVDYYENILLFSIKDEDVYDLYICYLNEKDTDIKLIEEGIDNLVGTSKTFDKIYYTKIDEDRKTLYCIRYFKDINIVKGGEFIDYLVNEDTGNIYFTISKDEKKYGTVYYYDSSEKELTKVNGNSCINDIIDGKNLSDIAFIKTENKNYLSKSGALLEFKSTDNIEHIYVREEDMTVFYLSKDNKGKDYNLYSMSTQGEHLQEPELIDKDVESVDKLYYGDVYYYKQNSDGNKDLYRSGQKLRSDVQKTFYLYGSIYIACKDREEGFTLYRLLNGKLRLVDKNMHSFRLLNRAYIAYIKDFEKSFGDLYLWTGEYSIHLKDGVKAIGNEFSLSRDVYEKEP